jgi:hypothetical protein
MSSRSRLARLRRACRCRLKSDAGSGHGAAVVRGMAPWCYGAWRRGGTEDVQCRMRMPIKRYVLTYVAVVRLELRVLGSNCLTDFVDYMARASVRLVRARFCSCDSEPNNLAPWRHIRTCAAAASMCTTLVLDFSFRYRKAQSRSDCSLASPLTHTRGDHVQLGLWSRRWIWFGCRVHGFDVGVCWHVE